MAAPHHGLRFGGVLRLSQDAVRRTGWTRRRGTRPRPTYQIHFVAVLARSPPAGGLPRVPIAPLPLFHAGLQCELAGIPAVSCGRLIPAISAILAGLWCRGGRRENPGTRCRRGYPRGLAWRLGGGGKGNLAVLTSVQAQSILPPAALAIIGSPIISTPGLGRGRWRGGGFPPPLGPIAVAPRASRWNRTGGDGGRGQRGCLEALLVVCRTTAAAVSPALAPLDPLPRDLHGVEDGRLRGGRRAIVNLSQLLLLPGQRRLDHWVGRRRRVPGSPDPLYRDL